MKVLVSDSDQSHANSMKTIISTECPSAIVDTHIDSLSASVTYALANNYSIISRSTTGLSDSRNENEGDTAWAGNTIKDGAFDAGFDKAFDANILRRVGIVHGFGTNADAKISDPSRLDVICAVAHEDGGYGAGLEFQTDDSSTSAATARVAGVIAQIMTDHPSWNFHDARQAIRQTCSNYSTGWTKETGFGTMDKTAARAVTSLDPMSPTRRTHSESSNTITVGWKNSLMTDYATTLIALFDEEPSRTDEPTGFYDSTGTSTTYDFYGKAGTYYLTWMTKDSSGNYSKIESFDYAEISFDDSWESKQEDILAYLKTLIDSIQRHESDIFGYVDYLTEENVNKIGSRFPAVLIEDGDEEWEGAGAGGYYIYHTINLYIYDKINQDRLEILLENQKAIIDEINDNNTLGGHAICANVEGAEKGNYYSGNINWQEVGYNDNISIRKIILRVWERTT